MDIAILGLLQNNARLSVTEFAAEVSLAPSSTHERIRRLRSSAVLRGTHAEVDPKALGIGLEALFMVELSKHKRGTVDRFMDDIAGVPEVRIAFLVTGRYDVVVHVVVRDMQHLKDLAVDRFTNRPGVHPYRDVDHLRGSPPLPTPCLPDGRLRIGAGRPAQPRSAWRAGAPSAVIRLSINPA